MNSQRVFEHFNSSHPGGYYLLDNGRLGGGGQAEVFAGKKKGADDSLAVKILSPEQESDIHVELFKNEANIMHELGEHPNIATVHYSGEFVGRTKQEKAQNIAGTRYLFTVMDQASGTLADEIAATKQTSLGRLPAMIATQYILDIVAGVGHAHGERQGGQREGDGVLHRDIKPANALLFPPNDSGRPMHVRLADFGISRRGYTSASAITQTHLGAGTWLYADPRQFYQGGAIYAHDQYMAATTAWHMLTGRPLFEEYSGDPTNLQTAHLQVMPQVEQLTTAEGRVDQVAEAAQIALLRALHKDPTQRYSTMAELGDTLLEAAVKASEQQRKNRSVHAVGALLGWQLPVHGEQTYLDAMRRRYNLGENTRLERRKLLAWGGLFVGSLAAAGYSLIHGNKNKSPTASPTESTTKSPKELLDDAFNNDPPKLPELTSAEKAAVKESIDAVNSVIVKWLKKQAGIMGSNHYGLERLISSLASYDANEAHDLWKWLDALSTPASDIGGKADTKAWAAAFLANTKTDEMTTILLSKDWADGGLLSDGSYTDTDTIKACNRGVLGCALARLKPGSVAKVVDTYTGQDSIARGYNDALKLALAPKQDAARNLDLLGFEQSAAAAFALAYENPDVLTNDMTARESDWKLDVTLFSRALKVLLDTRPKFVEGVLLRADLDSKVFPFDQGVTLEVALHGATKNPEITQNVLKQRRSDATQSGQSMLAMALAGYKPDIAKAISAEQPTDTLLKLSLDPTNSTLRDKAVKELDAALSKDYDDVVGKQPVLSRASHLAIAFMVGQQRRLG